MKLIKKYQNPTNKLNKYNIDYYPGEDFTDDMFSQDNLDMYKNGKMRVVKSGTNETLGYINTIHKANRPGKHIYVDWTDNSGNKKNEWINATGLFAPLKTNEADMSNPDSGQQLDEVVVTGDATVGKLMDENPELTGSQAREISARFHYDNELLPMPDGTWKRRNEMSPFQLDMWNKWMDNNKLQYTRGLGNYATYSGGQLQPMSSGYYNTPYQNIPEKTPAQRYAEDLAKSPAKNLDYLFAGMMAAGIAPFLAAEAGPALAAWWGTSPTAAALRISAKNPYVQGAITSLFAAEGANDIVNRGALSDFGSSWRDFYRDPSWYTGLNATGQTLRTGIDALSLYPAGAGLFKLGKEGYEAAWNLAAKTGNNTARARQLSKALNQSIDNTVLRSNPRSISTDYYIFDGVYGGDAKYTLYDEFGTPIGNTYTGSGLKGNRMIDGIASKNHGHKVTEDTYNAIVQDLTSAEIEGLETGWSLMSPQKTLPVTKRFPHTVIGRSEGHDVRLLTGTTDRPIPQRVSGNHYQEIGPKTEIRYNESTGDFEEVPIYTYIQEPSTINWADVVAQQNAQAMRQSSRILNAKGIGEANPQTVVRTGHRSLSDPDNPFQIRRARLNNKFIGDYDPSTQKLINKVKVRGQDIRNAFKQLDPSLSEDELDLAVQTAFASRRGVHVPIGDNSGRTIGGVSVVDIEETLKYLRESGIINPSADDVGTVVAHEAGHGVKVSKFARDLVKDFRDPDEFYTLAGQVLDDAKITKNEEIPFGTLMRLTDKYLKKKKLDNGITEVRDYLSKYPEDKRKDLMKAIARFSGILYAISQVNRKNKNGKIN